MVLQAPVQRTPEQLHMGLLGKYTPLVKDHTTNRMNMPQHDRYHEVVIKLILEPFMKSAPHHQ